MVSAEAAGFIYYWLVEHIIKHDLKMREYVDKMKVASEGVEKIREVANIQLPEIQETLVLTVLVCCTLNSK